MKKSILFTFAILLGTGALAVDGHFRIAPPSAGGATYTPTATDHAGQNMTAGSITLSVDGGTVIMPLDSKICFDGPSCLRTNTWDTATSAFLMDGGVASNVSTANTMSFGIRDTTRFYLNYPTNGAYITYSSAASTITLSSIIVSVPGRMTSPGGLVLTSTTLGTCASNVEGVIRNDSTGGGTGTTKTTKLCFCASSGAASPTYKWLNIHDVSTFALSTGTTTTCPDFQ